MGLLSSSVPQVSIPQPITNQPQPRPMRDELWSNKFLVECWSSKSSVYSDETERALAHQSPNTSELVLREAGLFDELDRSRVPHWKQFQA